MRFSPIMHQKLASKVPKLIFFLDDPDTVDFDGERNSKPKLSCLGPLKREYRIMQESTVLLLQKFMLGLLFYNTRRKLSVGGILNQSILQC
jgi:hypothetical protein